MRKNIFTITAILIVIASLLTLGGVAVKMADKTSAYTRTAEGTILAVNGTVVAVETADGNVWEFYGDDFEVGQTVKIIFSNNGSPDTVKDDCIKWVG